MVISRQHPNYARERVLERAQGVAVHLAAMSSFGMVKRVSMAVGSPYLGETYKRLPDQGVPSRILIHMSIELDQAGEFPMGQLKDVSRVVDKKPMAKWVLRQLATQHIRLFPTKYATKQSVCKVLDITFEQLEAPDQPKLLKS
jgi:hypothetical protein